MLANAEQGLLLRKDNPAIHHLAFAPGWIQPWPYNIRLSRAAKAGARCISDFPSTIDVASCNW